MDTLTAIDVRLYFSVHLRREADTSGLRRAPRGKPLSAQSLRPRVRVGR